MRKEKAKDYTFPKKKPKTFQSHWAANKIVWLKKKLHVKKEKRKHLCHPKGCNEHSMWLYVGVVVVQSWHYEFHVGAIKLFVAFCPWQEGVSQKASAFVISFGHWFTECGSVDRTAISACRAYTVSKSSLLTQAQYFSWDIQYIVIIRILLCYLH